VCGTLAFANVKRDKLEAWTEKCVLIGYIEGAKEGEVKCFICKDVKFNKAQMTIMANNPKKNKEKAHVEVQSPSFELDYLKQLDDDESNDGDQPSTSHSGVLKGLLKINKSCVSYKNQCMVEIEYVILIQVV